VIIFGLRFVHINQTNKNFMLNKEGIIKKNKNYTMNKKTILAVLMLALTASSTFARDLTERKNLGGVIAGFSINSAAVENESAQKAKNRAKLGGVIGVTFEHKFGKVFALETGALFSNKGASEKLETNALVKSGSYTVDFYSVDVPLIAKFYIGKKKIFNLNVGGFASYSFKVQTTTKIDFNNNPVFPNDINNKENNPKDADGDLYYQPYDAGLNVGFEFISKKGFGAGARLNQGLIDATNPKYNIGSVSDTKKTFHTGAQLYAIFKF
jgi:hypothetical protein